MNRQPLLSRRQILAAGVSCAALGLARPTTAQTVSKLLIAAAPGGATDLLTRLYAQWLTEEAGRTFIAENRPGGGGVIATELVQKAPPDGSVMFLGALSHVANLGMMDNVHYDPVKDFTPIAKLLTFGSVLVVNASVPVKDMKEFIAYVKARPGKLNWGLGATGTSQHLAGALLAKEAGLQYVAIPYKGGGPAMSELIGGRVQFMIESIPTALPHIQSGKIRALGVTGAQRSSGLPDVPTISEAAIAGFDVEAWFALMGPAGIPQPFVQSTYEALQRIMAKPAVTARLVSLGAKPNLTSPADTRAFIENEYKRWIPIIRESGIKAA
jgi:tripartite-type tricarboxylate transporter receptor subunit TctC